MKRSEVVNYIANVGRDLEESIKDSVLLESRLSKAEEFLSGLESDRESLIEALAVLDEKLDAQRDVRLMLSDEFEESNQKVELHQKRYEELKDSFDLWDRIYPQAINVLKSLGEESSNKGLEMLKNLRRQAYTRILEDAAVQGLGELFS